MRQEKNRGFFDQEEENASSLRMKQGDLKKTLFASLQTYDRRRTASFS
jgi:hypothetical protein